MTIGRAGAGAAAAVVAVIAYAATPAAARDKEFGVGIGYAHVELDGAASPFDGRGGIRVEPRFSWAAGGDDAAAGSHLRLGVGLSFSGFERSADDGDIIIIDEDDGDVFVLDSDEVEALTLITPEFQVSWRQMLGAADDDGQQRWFVEPGLGLGVVVGQYWVGETFGWWTDTDVNEWDATLAARPFIRAGYQADGWVLGLEASYLIGGKLEFTDETEGDVQEWYAGVFFGGRW